MKFAENHLGNFLGGEGLDCKNPFVWKSRWGQSPMGPAWETVLP